ncbi:type II toxin-antitoxin system VapC family toxin [Glutamicibacter sp. NPDC127525]|uniref:type II toxin-antitoxin system VapC family toxin n=1 Tax=unclassified Glutamicibacter TaxID=2627139 RepID=UPI003640F04A
MKSRQELIVIDTCVYVDALYAGHARADNVDMDRARRSARLIEAVDRGEYLAGLLPIVLVEINSSTQLGAHLDFNKRQARKECIDKYFRGLGHVVLEHDERVALLGAKLARQEQRKAPDMLIVASAAIHEASTLYSWDSDVLSLDGNPLVNGLRILEPPTDVATNSRTLFDVLAENENEEKTRVLKKFNNDLQQYKG